MMINEYQTKVFKDLMNLVNSNNAFYKKEEEFIGGRYFIFNYRLAFYSDFLEPNALEARGITFLVDKNDNPLKLVCWPMEKFFNINENPFTENVDYENIHYAMIKEDGSIISSMIDRFGDLTLKSKSQIMSKQSIAASEWLALPENSHFYNTLKEMTEAGFTVNMEWVSPDNRIILEYDKPALKVLNARFNSSGDYYNQKALQVMFNDCPMVESCEDYKHFNLNILKKFSDIEGWVIKPVNHYHNESKVNFCKIKTNWYLNLHKLKFSVEVPKALFFCCLNEQSDDIRSAFSNDKELIKRVDLMERIVKNNYNYICQEVDSFYEENKHLQVKEFAIKAKDKMPRFHAILMSLYNGTSYTVKKYMEKNYKDMVEIFNQLGGYDV